VATYLYAILLYKDNGDATADDTAKWYMRRVTGGGSTTVDMAEQRGVSAFAWEGRMCAPLLDVV
jgi:hypothetical protein